MSGYIEIGGHKYPVQLDPNATEMRLVNRRQVVVKRNDLLNVALEVVDLVMRKNHDYGDAWQRQGINGVLVRLADKLYRIENLQGQEALVPSEALEDTLRDAIGYAMLGLLYIRANST